MRVNALGRGVGVGVGARELDATLRETNILVVSVLLVPTKHLLHSIP